MVFTQARNHESDMMRAGKISNTKARCFSRGSFGVHSFTAEYTALHKSFYLNYTGRGYCPNSLPSFCMSPKRPWSLGSKPSRDDCLFCYTRLSHPSQRSRFAASIPSLCSRHFKNHGTIEKSQSLDSCHDSHIKFPGTLAIREAFK